MANKYLTLVLAVLLGTSLLACKTTVPSLSGTTMPVATTQGLTPPIVGRADFSSIRMTQSTVSNILDTATIALYDAQTSETRTSTVSDSSGNFTLNMPGFNPVVNGTYILEAIKGLGAQLPGRTAPRLRTILKYTSTGWQSITNGTVGGSIVINAHTTAVAIASGLDPVALPAANTMGRVTPGSSALVNPWPYTTPATADINALANDVITTLSGDNDPVAVTNAMKPNLQGMTPSSGGANQIVSLTGIGFAGGTTTVKMNGVAVPSGNVLIITPSQIVFTVPVGATTGNVVVNTSRGGDSNGLPFTVPNSAAVSIQAISPNPARPNASVTVTGTGFSTTLANNTINVNGINKTPDFANTTSLVFTVPSNATSGNVNVTVGGQTSNNYYLTVESLTTPQIVGPLFPTSGPTKSILAIKGQNFGPDGSVLIGDYKAKVISWSPNIIRVQVPYLVPNGAQQVTVFAPLGIATQSFTVYDGSTIDSWTGVTSLPADVGGPGVHAYVGGEKLWVWGGVGSTKVYYMRLDVDGSFLDTSWTDSGFTLPEGTYQDDNPNSRTQIKNRIYYTVTNNRSASNKSHINFASLDPYTGAVLGFAYDPINDLPPTWVGKDLALVSSDRYVYIMGHGPSCTGDGVSCGNNPVGTMQARILESGNIGVWGPGPNQKPYGEDGLPFILGDVIYQVGGTSGVSQQCILDAAGAMSATSGWATMSVPLIPDGDNLSCMPNLIGKYYYFWDMWSARRSYKGEIVDDLVPQQAVALSGSGSPSGAGVACGLAHVDVQVGKYVYLISSNQGGGGQYQVVCRGTIR